ncbi:hypothetical protein NIHE100087_05250 [Enterobacter hormaechei]|nr:hypothetical protein NIHE100087_05250 [Enterobacter hormaechei]
MYCKGFKSKKRKVAFEYIHRNAPKTGIIAINPGHGVSLLIMNKLVIIIERPTRLSVLFKIFRGGMIYTNPPASIAQALVGNIK